MNPDYKAWNWSVGRRGGMVCGSRRENGRLEESKRVGMCVIERERERERESLER